jgi:hypothetical protein
MDPALPTDEVTNRFFDDVVSDLHCNFGYSMVEASNLIREYYVSFRDAEFCRAIRVPVQDDDYFLHEGVRGMALRIHYYLGIKGDPDPQAFIMWRTSLQSSRTKVEKRI